MATVSGGDTMEELQPEMRNSSPERDPVLVCTMEQVRNVMERAITIVPDSPVPDGGLILLRFLVTLKSAETLGDFCAHSLGLCVLGGPSLNEYVAVACWRFHMKDPSTIRASQSSTKCNYI